MQKDLRLKIVWRLRDYICNVCCFVFFYDNSGGVTYTFSVPDRFNFVSHML